MLYEVITSGGRHRANLAAQTNALVYRIRNVRKNDRKVAADLPLDDDGRAHQLQIRVLCAAYKPSQTGFKRHAILCFTIDAHELARNGLFHLIGNVLHRRLKRLTDAQRVADDRKRIGQL